MERTTTLDAFLGNPNGHFYAERGFIVWCKDETLSGAQVWGILDAQTAEQLITALDAVKTQRTITDMHEMLITDPVVFRTLAAHLKRDGQVVVTPEDPFSGALVRRNSASVAVAVDAAVEAIGEPELTQALCQMYRQATQAATIIESLRRVMSEAPAELDLAGAARVLGISSRSLQRHLRAAGSSFGEEAQRVRFSITAKLLSTTDTKISAIARTVGYSSDAHFAKAFRSVYGVAPSEWRQRARLAV